MLMNESSNLRRSFLFQSVYRRVANILPTRQAIATPVREKWHTLSIDTFWWKYPIEFLDGSLQNQYVAGLSMLDEATDYWSTRCQTSE